MDFKHTPCIKSNMDIVNHSIQKRLEVTVSKLIGLEIFFHYLFFVYNGYKEPSTFLLDPIGHVRYPPKEVQSNKLSAFGKSF